MKKQRIFAVTAVGLLLMLSILSTVEVQAAEKHVSFRITTAIEKYQQSLPFIKEDQSVLKQLKQIVKIDENKYTEMKNHIMSQLREIRNSSLAVNFTSLDLIMSLFGSLVFLLMTQPIFLQFIVETGNQFYFIAILISLLITEIMQKFFSLKVIGIWDPYIKDDVDGIWNFFSIVFLSLYIKIYLSYLPTFIIQYSNIITQVFFYALMFAIPILFNICIADSIDMIDWNRDEIVTPL